MIAMKKRKWVMTLGLGLLGNWLITWCFDFLLYPFVIARSGIIYGGFIMTFLSFIICYLSILFYDGTKKDWLGIETIKSVEEFQPKKLPSFFLYRYATQIFNLIGFTLAFLMKKSDLLLMIVLSIKFDPFITVLHIRHGSHQYNGLSARDWKVFLISLLIGNIYWTLAVYMGISLFELVFNYLRLLF